jgi:gas vesicle protein
MQKDETAEYLTTFVIGALIGVGAALLFAPKPPTRRERIMKELKPYRKKINKQSVRARKEVGRRATAAADWGDDMVEASRDLMGEIRAQVSDMVADARTEIADSVARQLENAQQSLRNSAKRIRS